MRLKTIFVLVLSGWICGCALLREGITYYDPTTYKNLVDLKVEVTFLYESFTSTLDLKEARTIRMRLTQAVEYEKGKGDPNKETVRLLELIKDDYEDNLKNRIEQGRWNNTQMENALVNIHRLFDQAIKAERIKNKG